MSASGLQARFGRIGNEVRPVVWSRDLGLHVGVLGEQVTTSALEDSLIDHFKLLISIQELCIVSSSLAPSRWHASTGKFRQMWSARKGSTCLG
jgi:hypothetical protein